MPPATHDERPVPANGRYYTIDELGDLSGHHERTRTCWLDGRQLVVQVLLQKSAGGVGRVLRPQSVSGRLVTFETSGKAEWVQLDSTVTPPVFGRYGGQTRTRRPPRGET